MKVGCFAPTALHSFPLTVSILKPRKQHKVDESFQLNGIFKIGTYEDGWRVELRDDFTLWLHYLETSHPLYIDEVREDGSVNVNIPRLESPITFHAQGNRVLLTF